MAEYLDLMSRWEAMPVDRRFQVMATLWPKLPAALQVAILGLVWALVQSLTQQSETPDTPIPARAS